MMKRFAQNSRMRIAGMCDDHAAVTIGSLLGMVLVVLVFAAVITIIGGNIATAAANDSLLALGVAGLLSLVVLILVVVVIAGLAKSAE